MDFPDINPQISIADLLARYPQAVIVLIQHHMGCVGCHMAAFDSLEYATGIYHIPVEDLIREIHQAFQADNLST